MKKRKECKEIIKLIQKEIDSRITVGERDILERHISECNRCALEKEEMIKLHNLLQENIARIEVPQLSADFNRKFYQRLGGSRVRSSIFGNIIENIFRVNRVAELRLVSVTVFIVLVGVISMNWYNEYMRDLKQVEVDRYQKETNLNTLYNMVTEQSEKTELKSIADKQAKEIVAIMGIRG